MFQLTAKELEDLRCQIGTSSLRSQSVTSSAEPIDVQRNAADRSQSVTGSHGGRRHLPWAFTEHGALMAANVLRSRRAVEMSVFVVRAFVQMRAALSANRALARQLVALEQALKDRLDTHDAAVITHLQHVLDILNPPRKEIGFHVKERRATYNAA